MVDDLLTDDKDVKKMQRQSVQSRARSGPEDGAVGVFNWLVRAGEIVAPWWSQQRDLDLRKFWKRCDHLSGAIYSMQSWITTQDFRVVPRDPSIAAHRRQAEEYTEVLLNDTEFGGGWEKGVSKWLEDLLVCDNGAFFEVIGPGRKDGPVTGRPTGLAALDSSRCMRTKSVDFPVIYLDQDGYRYKLHRTRVMMNAQMASPISEMNGVGLGAVSRCVNAAQNLIDVAIFNQEKLGSRPARQIIIGKKGLTATDIWMAFLDAAEQMDNAGLRRFAKTVVLAPTDRMSGAEIDLDIQTLSSAPDGFDQQQSITLGMFCIALAFGVEARFLWPASVTGATKADALTQSVQGRRKGRGQILKMLQRNVNRKFLPPQLMLQVDSQDDEEDAAQADIQTKRAERRSVDLTTGVTDIRTERQRMLDSGEINQAQYEELELKDGRLPNGQPVLTLFVREGDGFEEILEVGVSEPLAVSRNDPYEVLANIEDALIKAREALANSGLSGARSRARQAIAALEELQKLYEKEATAGTAPTLEQAPSGESVAEEAEPEEPKQPEVVIDQEPEALKEEASPSQEGGFPLEAEAQKAFEQKSVTDFRRSVRAAIRGYWDETWDRFEFVDQMVSALERNLTKGWNFGASKCNISPDELTPDELRARSDFINSQFEFLPGFADHIELHSKKEGGKLGPLFVRGEMWINQYQNARHRGQAMACADQKAIWVLGGTVQHCRSCLGFAGRVYRMSVWNKSGALPQSSELICGGWNCRCFLLPTDANATPGRFPASLLGGSKALSSFLRKAGFFKEAARELVEDTLKEKQC